MVDQESRVGRGAFLLLLALIVLIAGWVRLFNLNWDQGTHLHPDERYLTMVAGALELPAAPTTYWDTLISPLNPENRGYGGYVYGTLPLFFTRVVGEWLDQACAEPPNPLAVTYRRVLLRVAEPCYPGHYTGYGGIHLVGRTLSVFADLLSLVALALLARLLFGDWVGLFAGTLYAFTVLPIQHAHFFVVDSFGTVFVVWTLLFAVYAVVRQRRWTLLLAGVTTGLAVASKISTWPIAAMVGLAGLIEVEDGEHRLVVKNSNLLLLLGSGALALLAFRVAQPYAFAGPGFFGVRLSDAWLESMRRIQKLVSGEVDTPPGHQWTNRPPILFPWRNMVFWGMGLPLGLTAWLGWGLLGWRTFRTRRWAQAIPWLWGSGFFLYQGTQWVKSMRYLLPIYPVFVLFAAWILFQGIRWALRSRPRNALHRIVRPILLAAPLLVFAGTVAWTLAFLNIYAQPFTRVEASRWIYHHVPTAVTLHTQTGLDLHVPVQPNTSLIPDGVPHSTRYTLPTGGNITEVRLNKVMANSFLDIRHFEVQLTADEPGMEVLAQGELRTPIDSLDPLAVTVPLDSPLSVEAGETFYVQLTLLDGPPIVLGTSILGNEHWDDPLPVPLDGKNPFGNWYRGLPSSHNTLMNLYDNDDAAKRDLLLLWLDDVDYIMLSSNRLYGSIPRLPLRYPLTTAYYRALFDGSLGFELAAEFASFPALGRCQFPDQELPFGLPDPRYTTARPCSVPYPPAEEAFSVYDHPTVLIFAKTPSYSGERAEELLPLTLVENVRWMTPLQATRQGGETPSLLMEPREREVQETGGTWSRLFHRHALHNRYHWLAAILWWLLLFLLGWLAFPWLTLAFPALRNRGYGLARIAGLLLWAYPPWLLASLHLVAHTRLLLWGAFLCFAAASALLVRSRWEEFRTLLRDRWQDLLRIEIIFAGLYLVWVLVRYLNPDLYHPVAGGEKPMDFAYLNAVIRSSWFPPYDPWFAGGIMNYYYFGFVLMGSLIEALGIVPSVAYNLAIPSLLAMTGVGAYTLASNLIGGTEQQARRAGLWGVALGVLLGNLGELKLIAEGLEQVGQVHFESLIPGYRFLISTLAGLWKVVVQGRELAFRPEWWYWNASRIVEPGPGEYVGPINEFPLFTYLYADLHAHAIALPLTQVALAVALQWGIGRYRTPLLNVSRSLLGRVRAWLPRPFPTFFLAALVAGALRATNTWDYPTYLGLMILGYLLPLMRELPLRKETPTAPVSDTATPETGETVDAARPPFPYHRFVTPVALVLLAELLFRPFTTHYMTTYNAVEPWLGSKTPLNDYLIMHGQFLLPLALIAAVETLLLFRRMRARHRQEPVTLLASLGIVAFGALLLTLVLSSMGVQIAWIVVLFGTVAALLLLDVEHSRRTQTLWLWVGTALAVTLAVEIVVLKGDIGRMNTVFKPYVQVWTLFSVTAAVATERLWSALFWNESRSRAEHFWHALARRRPAVGDIVLGILLVVVFATALYPIFAIPAKIRDRWNPQAPYSLDGMVFLDHVIQHENDAVLPLTIDARVIRWLQENIEGSPTIMEKNAEVEYIKWGNRMSIYTGLPTVIGWRWHQAQQRMVMPGGTVERRQWDVSQFYNTPDPEEAWAILQEYGVEYVVLTPYERLYMLQPQNLTPSDPISEDGEGADAGQVTPEEWRSRAEAKFEILVEQGRLEVVFDDATIKAKIYRVVK
ncbi:MAG: DUF2298 domain-containing protein [Anaerolineales bacterium]